MQKQRSSYVPTRAGWLFFASSAGTLLLAALTGNNLLYMLAGGHVAVLVLDAIFGRLNLQGLEVRRGLPVELFAGVEARGRFAVRNTRRWLPAIAFEISERDGGGARAFVGRVGPRGESAVGAGWAFPGRGFGELDRLRLMSLFPFGLALRSVESSLPAAILVYPRPRPSPLSPEPEGGGLHEEADVGRGGTGDFVGLRPYRPGDPPRTLHWPTSAKVGEPMVLIRTAESAERVVVRVRDRAGAAWEAELGRACAEVLRGFARGCRVGMELPEDRLEARSGAAWRRSLLEVLARQPERPA